jgi:putative hydrolase of the HAD superfamily
MAIEQRLAPKAILFDLDNTLCTFVDAKRTACNAVIQEIGVGDADTLFQYFLRPTRNFEDPAHIDDYLTDIKIYTTETSDKVKEVFTRTKIESITLYPGVTQVLDTIMKTEIKLAVITDANSTNALQRMKRLGIEKYFPVLITPDISGKRKPDHTPFLMALKILNTNPDATWLVGDSIRREMIPGNQLGLTTIYARYGDWILPDIADVTPDYIIDQFTDLMRLPGMQDYPLP